LNKWILALFALVFIAAPLKAQPVCVSYFASEAFSTSQCKEALKVFDGVRHPCMATLWGTFGRHGPDGCTAHFLRKFGGRKHTLEIQFENWSGRRRHALKQGELFPTFGVSQYVRKIELKDTLVIARIRARAEAIAKFLSEQASENAEIIVTTGLEDNLSNRAYRIVLAELKKTLPANVLLARNPEGADEKNHSFDGADFAELHTVSAKFNQPGKCIVSLDGQDIDFTNSRREDNRNVRYASLFNQIRRYRARHCYFILWWAAVQGKQSINPRSRSFSFSSKNISLINLLLRRFSHE
jgi:hypothetical protein